VRAWESGAERAERWSDPRTYAAGLRVPAAIGDELMLRAVRESRGIAIAVADPEIAAGQIEMARGEGIFGAPEGGATVAAARRLVERGWIGRNQRVVLFNTGSGLKIPSIPGLSIV
jgi:threonine synthase